MKNITDMILSNPLRMLGFVGMLITVIFGGEFIAQMYNSYQQHQGNSIEVEGYIIDIVDNCTDPNNDNSCRSWADYTYNYNDRWYETTYEHLVPSSLRHDYKPGMTIRATVLPDDPTNSLLVGNKTEYLRHLQLGGVAFLWCLFAFCMNPWKTDKPRSWFENLCFYSRSVVFFAAVGSGILFGQIHILNGNLLYLMAIVPLIVLLLPTALYLLILNQSIHNKLHNISLQNLKPPKHIKKGVDEIIDMGFTRTGELALDVFGQMMPVWCFHNEDGTVYVELYGDKNLKATFITRHNELQFLQTEYPEGKPFDALGSITQINKQSLAAAYQDHIRAMPAADTIHPVQSIDDVRRTMILTKEMIRPYEIQTSLKNSRRDFLVALVIIMFVVFWRLVGYDLAENVQYAIAYGTLLLIILIYEVPNWAKQYRQLTWQ